MFVKTKKNVLIHLSFLLFPSIYSEILVSLAHKFPIFEII